MAVNQSPYNGFQSEQKLLMFWYSIFLMGVFSLVLLYYLDREGRRLEAAMMLTVVAQLREATMIKTAELLVLERKADLKKFVNSNPMNWLKPAPLNYSGTIGPTEKLESLQAARWYFDEATSTLVYKASEPEDFSESGPEPGVVRFRVELAYVDRNQSGSYEEGIDKVTALELNATHPFRWRNLNK